MPYGTVKWFNAKTGAGYIRTDRGEDVLFLNGTIRDSERGLIHKGARVCLDVLKGQYGLTAINVRSTELLNGTVNPFAYNLLPDYTKPDGNYM